MTVDRQGPHRRHQPLDEAHVLDGLEGRILNDALKPARQLATSSAPGGGESAHGLKNLGWRDFDAG